MTIFSVSRFFPAAISVLVSSFLCVSCGSGSSGSSSGTSSNSGDISASTSDSSTGLYNTTCGTSDNTFVVNEMENSNSIPYGNMQSDINEYSSIAACSSGQFVFNGQCYDSISFNDSNGAIYFTKNGNSTFISQSDTALGQDIIDHASYLYSDNSLNVGCNMTLYGTGPFYFNSCSSLSYYAYGSDSPFGITKFSWYNPYQSSVFYPYGDTSTENYASLYSFNVNFKMNYGECYNGSTSIKKMTYVWYINGSITLNNQKISVSPTKPLSASAFLSIYPINTSSTIVTCNPFYTGIGKNKFTCYQLATNWGSYVMYFDTNHNFSHIEVDYNPTNIKAN